MLFIHLFGCFAIVIAGTVVVVVTVVVIHNTLTDLS